MSFALKESIARVIDSPDVVKYLNAIWNELELATPLT